MEIYQGTKFETELEKKEIFSQAMNKINKVLYIDWFFSFFGVNSQPSPNALSSIINFKDTKKKKDTMGEQGSAGNISFRHKDGFIITAAYADISKLKLKDFVFIKEVDIEKRIVRAIGLREPSSETMMHSAIYDKRKDVKAIFHGHNDKILRNSSTLDLVSTKEFAEYGTVKLIDSVMEVLRRNTFIILKDHGFLSLGKDIDQCVMKILQINKKIAE